MRRSPEVLEFNPNAFSDDFFKDYEAQLADIDIEEQASLALAEVLMIKKSDGTEKSYEELRDETRSFFNNDWVRNDEALLNQMALQFAQACMGHSHGNELMQDSVLGSLFEKEGASSSHHDHSHDEYETDPLTGKRKKKKKKKK